MHAPGTMREWVKLAGFGVSAALARAGTAPPSRYRAPEQRARARVDEDGRRRRRSAERPVRARRDRLRDARGRAAVRRGALARRAAADLRPRARRDRRPSTPPSGRRSRPSRSSASRACSSSRARCGTPSTAPRPRRCAGAAPRARRRPSAARGVPRRSRRSSTRCRAARARCSGASSSSTARLRTLASGPASVRGPAAARIALAGAALLLAVTGTALVLRKHAPADPRATTPPVADSAAPVAAAPRPRPSPRQRRPRRPRPSPRPAADERRRSADEGAAATDAPPTPRRARPRTVTWTPLRVGTRAPSASREAPRRASKREAKAKREARERGRRRSPRRSRRRPRRTAKVAAAKRPAKPAAKVAAAPEGARAREAPTADACIVTVGSKPPGRRVARRSQPRASHAARPNTGPPAATTSSRSSAPISISTRWRSSRCARARRSRRSTRSSSGATPPRPRDEQRRAQDQHGEPRTSTAGRPRTRRERAAGLLRRCSPPVPATPGRPGSRRPRPRRPRPLTPPRRPARPCLDARVDDRPRLHAGALRCTSAPSAPQSSRSVPLSMTPSQSSSKSLQTSARGAPGVQDVESQPSPSRAHQPVPQRTRAPSSIWPVAVVVLVVAQLGRAAVDRRVVVVAVVGVGRVALRRTRSPSTVGPVGDAVAVAVHVDVAGHDRQALVDHAVAVVVALVADLGRARVDALVAVVAVAVLRRVVLGQRAVARVAARRRAPAVAVEVADVRRARAAEGERLEARAGPVAARAAVAIGGDAPTR